MEAKGLVTVGACLRLQGLRLPRSEGAWGRWRSEGVPLQVIRNDESMDIFIVIQNSTNLKDQQKFFMTERPWSVKTGKRTI